MTNKQVISRLKKDEMLSAPDIWPALENTTIAAEAPKPVRLRHKKHAVIAACTASVLAVGILIISLSGLWNTSHEPAPAPVDTMPHWYLPSCLTATTLTYQEQQTTAKVSPAVGLLKTGSPAAGQIRPLSATGQNIVLETSPQTPIKRNINAQVLDISAQIQAPEHQNCAGLFFDTKAQQVICISHIVKEAMQLAQTEEIFLDEYGTNLDYATYTVSATKQSYIINIRTKQYRQLPVSLYGKTLSVSASADYRYLLFGKSSTKDASVDDVFLIDLQDMTYKNIAENYPAYMFSMLSADGQTACFSVREQDGSLPEFTDGKWIVYSVQADTYHEITGEFLQFLPNNAIAFQTKDGYLIDGGDSDSSVNSQNAYIISEIVADDIGRNLLRTDLTNNAQKQIFSKPVSAYTVSQDGRYLYTYTLGDNSIVCVNIETLEQFSVPISEEFISQTTALSKDNRIVFQLSVNQESTEILLCFYTVPGGNEPKPEPPVSSDAQSKPDNLDEWDVAEHSAESTVQHFRSFTLVKYDGSTIVLNKDVKGYSQLVSLFEIINGLEYKKSMVAGVPGVSASGMTYELSCSGNTMSDNERICFTYTPDDRYLVQLLHHKERYCFISKDLYDKICGLCDSMVKQPQPDVSYPSSRPIPNVSSSSSRPVPEERYDFRNHTAEDTVNRFYFHITPWEPFFHNPMNVGLLIEDKKKLSTVIDILKRQSYTKMPLSGQPIQKFQRVYFLHMSDGGGQSEYIDIGMTIDGRYYAYAQYGIDGYCYLSEQDYAALESLFKELIDWSYYQEATNDSTKPPV